MKQPGVKELPRQVAERCPWGSILEAEGSELGVRSTGPESPKRRRVPGGKAAGGEAQGRSCWIGEVRTRDT